MPGPLTVQLEKLLQTADDLDTLAGKLQQHMSELDKDVRRVAEGWEGEAQQAFADCYEQWHRASDDLHRALRTLHTITRTAHQNYAAAGAANVRMWSGT
jgi:WXG100 family type VII secretion target